MTDKAKNAAVKNPLVLALVGDAVFTLYVREILAQKNIKAGELHTQASSYICASAQSSLFEKIQPLLNETEKDIAKRARNAYSNSYPKNCSLAEYKRATALEAVLGFQYLSDNLTRMYEFLKEANIC